MAGQVVYEGDPAAQLARLSRDLKAAGRVELRRELLKAVRVAAKPLIPAAKDEAARILPHGVSKGGQNKKIGGKRARYTDSPIDRVVGASYSTRIYAGRDPGVRLRGIDRAGRVVNLAALDRGVLRHPLFGDRDNWYTTRVTPGFWSRPMEKAGPYAYTQIILAIRRVNSKF